MLEQPSLPLDPSSESRQISIRADHAMTGHHDGDGIATVRRTHRTHGLRRADAQGNRCVRRHLTERNLSQRSPHAFLELRPSRRERQAEACLPPPEVFRELSARGGEYLRRVSLGAAATLLDATPRGNLRLRGTMPM